jgi:hypothetical protein
VRFRLACLLAVAAALAIAEAAKPVLIRPLAEMNNSKNPYCAFTPGGSSRGAAYSTRWYKRAPQRRVRFVSFYNGLAGGAYDLGTKPRSLAAYRRFIVPLS